MKNLNDQTLRRVLLLPFLCCLNVAAFSQTVLDGMVTDPEGNPLKGVTVSNQTQGHILMSDEHVAFSVQAKVSEIITFSLIGYQSHKLTLANLGSVRISLNPTGEDLEEVGISQELNVKFNISLSCPAG